MVFRYMCLLSDIPSPQTFPLSEKKQKEAKQSKNQEQKKKQINKTKQQ